MIRTAIIFYFALLGVSSTASAQQAPLAVQDDTDALIGWVDDSGAGGGHLYAISFYEHHAIRFRVATTNIRTDATTYFSGSDCTGNVTIDEGASTALDNLVGTVYAIGGPDVFYVSFSEPTIDGFAYQSKGRVLGVCEVSSGTVDNVRPAALLFEMQSQVQFPVRVTKNPLVFYSNFD